MYGDKSSRAVSNTPRCVTGLFADACSVLTGPQNFVHALLDPPPPPVSVLAMIRLNDAIHHSKSCPAAAFDSYLVGTRLSLWPLFQRGMDAQAESLRKIASTSGTSVFKSGGSVAKEQAVSSALRHYAALFTAVVALSEDADDEMVFNRCAAPRFCKW